MIKGKLKMLIIVTMMVVLVFSFNLTGLGAEDTVKLGHIVPFTGDLSFIGEPFQNAAELAVENVNEAGGILGKKVEIISEDSGTDARGAVDALDKLININGIKVLEGGISTIEASAIIQKVKFNQVLNLSPSATSPKLTEADDGDYFFRTCPSDALQGASLAKLARDKGYETASVISRTDDYGLGLERIFTEKFKEMGGEIVRTVRYDPKAPDFSGYVNKVTGKEADVILVNALMEDGTRLFKRMKDMGVIEDFEFLVCEGVQDPGIPKEVGAQAMAGIGGATPYPEKTGEFVTKYKEKYGEEPVAYCANVYDNFVLMSLALQKAGEYDGTAARDALREVANPPGQEVNNVAEALELVKKGEAINYQGAGGQITFDENGDIKATQARVWRYNESGSIENIEVMKIESEE